MVPSTKGNEMEAINLAGEIVFKANDKQQVFGWASVSTRDGQEVIDLQGDMISPDDLSKMAYSFVLDSREAGVMHEVVGIGKLIESVVMNKEKADAMGITLPQGFGDQWWVGFAITDPGVWDRVKKGELRAFSIHGQAQRQEIVE